MKLAWGVPRSTHRYFVDNFLSTGIPSLKASLLSCYLKFHESVKSSPSLEVRVVASLASQDLRSTTGSNLHGIRQLSNVDFLSSVSSASVKNLLCSTSRLVEISLSSEIPSGETQTANSSRKYQGN